MSRKRKVDSLFVVEDDGPSSFSSTSSFTPASSAAGSMHPARMRQMNEKVEKPQPKTYKVTRSESKSSHSFSSDASPPSLSHDSHKKSRSHSDASRSTPLPPPQPKRSKQKYGNHEGNEEEDDDDGEVEEVSSRRSERDEEQQDGNDSSHRKKKSKSSAPLEVSSKVKPSRSDRLASLTSLATLPRYRPADPRFLSESAGDFNSDAFSQSYSFLQDYKRDELNELKTIINKKKKSNWKGVKEESKTELINDVKQREQELKLKIKNDKYDEMIKNWKKGQREAKDQGKKPIWLKESDKKAMKLTANYLQLKASGQLSKTLEKRRKHNAAKDHRFMPRERKQAGGDDGDE